MNNSNGHSNGSYQNGAHSNGNRNGHANGHSILTAETNGNGSHPAVTTTTNGAANRMVLTSQSFDQPVILKQSPFWPRAIVWTIMGVTTAVTVWACVAKIEEAIPATGKLEPQGTVHEIQAPVGGVVKSVFVKDGQRVKQGERLVTFDSTASQAELVSLQKVRNALTQENEFYRGQMSGRGSQATMDATSRLLQLPPALASLTQNRAALVAETELYRTQLRGDAVGAGLTLEERARLQAANQEANTRSAAARLEVDQLEKQLEQTRIALINNREMLAVEQKITGELKVLVEQGAFGRLQYLKQEQEVRSLQAERGRLEEEQKRLQAAIAQAGEKWQNTLAVTQDDLHKKVADNEKRIAEIDTQLTKAIVENEKRIAEIDSKLSQTNMTLSYQDIESPVSGTIFDLQARSPGFVTNSTEPILKIVPAESLVAEVFITNKDIGFVKEGMEVDVRIDSFPFSEFGDVKGELIWIGSDALPPDQVHQFFRFPAKIRLKQQSLLINGREVALQSGMSVSVNIKVRNRTVASIFTDLFSKKMESLKFVR